MRLPRIILAENDPAAQLVIEMTLRQRVHCELSICRYGYEITQQLKQHPETAMLIIDLQLPDVDSVELIEELALRYPTIPIIATASARDDKQVAAVLEAGAEDYLRKSDEPGRMATMIQTILNARLIEPSLEEEDKDAKKREAHGGPFSQMIGRSEALHHSIEQARQAAESDIPVLIHGESGVGKERMAQAIHHASRRFNSPFVAVNCGSIPPTLVESTLFGHVKGAFTGATSDASGKFREANGGTLFLDEVGELPADIQVSLLRVLQEKEVQPVGGGQPEKIDVRMISATHVNLEQAIASGAFREDLYYRLHVFPIEIPPLRQRGKADIVMLIQYFIERFARQEGKDVNGITEAAVGLLTSYPWPGNIRQLENAVYRAVVLTKEAKLKADDFVQISNALRQQQYDTRKQEAVQPYEVRLQQPESVDRVRNMVQLTNEADDFKSMREIEAEVLEKALLHYRWRITDIAQALGVTRATIYKKMKEAGLHDPRKAG